jgi:hypothetical protein
LGIVDNNGVKLHPKVWPFVLSQELRMRACNLSGPLPDSFARLIELRTLDLADNNLTGL